MNRSALIIANWQYQDAVLRCLVSPSQDAQALADVLGNSAIGGFDVKVLTNEPSWKVCEETEAFFGDRDRDDLLLLYFSGHGVTDDDGQLYYAAPNTSSKRLRSTAIAASWVNDIMNGCRSRRQVLLLDCCHSGAFAHTKGGGSVNVGRYFTGSTPEEGRGKFILTASDAFQYSFEGDAVEGAPANSVFTEAVVSGLRSGDADLDGDGRITLDELYTFVYRRVAQRGVKQTPRKWSSDVEGALVIASNPRPAEARLPDDLQAAIDSYVPAAREDAVPRLDRLLRGNHRGLSLTARKVLETLAADDSRRVSAAAQACLTAYEAEAARLEKERAAKQETDRVNAENARADRERAEQQELLARKAAAEKAEREAAEAAAAAEQERIAQKKLAADALARKAREFKQREAERIEAQRIEAERQQKQAEADRLAAEKAKRDRASLEEPPKQEPAPAEQQRGTKDETKRAGRSRAVPKPTGKTGESVERSIRDPEPTSGIPAEGNPAGPLVSQTGTEPVVETQRKWDREYSTFVRAQIEAQRSSGTKRKPQEPAKSQQGAIAPPPLKVSLLRLFHLLGVAVRLHLKISLAVPLGK